MAENKVDMYGKVAKFPKNTKAHKAYNFLENIKISKNRLWYILIENEINEHGEELKIVKYNNKAGVDLKKFVNELKTYYSKTEIADKVNELIVEGDSSFSVIKHIPDIMIGDKKLLTLITEDLIKLLK